MRWLFPFLLIIVSLPALAADSVSNPPPERDDGWPVMSLSEAGFDLERMRELDRKLEDDFYTNVHMVIVEYDGKLVYEKYLSGMDWVLGWDLEFREFDADSLHRLNSVTKSVTALLLGIALGDDYELALNRPIIEFFPEYRNQIADGAEKITLHHVLTMTDGWEWNEMDYRYTDNNNDYLRLFAVDNPIQHILTLPLRSEPGSAWYYNSGTTMLLGALVEKLSGKPFLDFAREKLGSPLSVPEEYARLGELPLWRSHLTLPAVASGLKLRARDAAKLGSLILHEGKWQGRQIVPAEWIRLSSQRHTEQTDRRWSYDGVYGYGYQWWHGRFEGAWGNFVAITAAGYGEQRVIVIPEEKLSVTVFAGNYEDGGYKVGERVASRVVAAAP